MSISWRLPQGITDLTPYQSNQLNQLSTALLQLWKTWGYQITNTPIVELVKANSLTANTFKTLDVDDGSILQIRSDITPQIARIDAKYNKNNKTNIFRYCYIENILSATADDFYASRNAIQAGLELYGSASALADIEIIELMHNSLTLVGFKQEILVGLGHTGFFNILVEPLNLSKTRLKQLKNIFNYKSKQDLLIFFGTKSLNSNQQDLLDLLDFNGDVKILSKLKKHYIHLPKMQALIQSLDNIVQALLKRNFKIHIDLTELKNQDYYSGLLFACFIDGHSKALAQGGRYDALDIQHNNQLQTKIRCATGFSFDLKFISSLFTSFKQQTITHTTWANDATTPKYVQEKREKGHIIIRDFDEQ